jgi:pimeloyl-ACP methyl ester carboxylesterase
LKVFNEKISEIGKALGPENKFDKPALFLRGENSDYILDQDLIAIEHHFPLAILETIKNAGHWLHAENPTDFYNTVLAFLKK